MKISVVVPAYNEEKQIRKMLEVYRSYLSKNFDEFELILVNDGSTDNTLEAAKAVEGVICISYPQNRGKGYAVKRGFLRATGDYIFFTDADLSYSPSNIGRGLEILCSEKSAGVAGIRSQKYRDYTFFRRIASDIFAQIAKRVISTPLSDTQCGFKGFERSVGKHIFSLSQIWDFGFDFEVIYLSQTLGKPVLPMSVSFKHRKATKVRMIRDGFCVLRDLVYIKRRDINAVVQKTI